jgi:hypothetical protein
LNAPRNEGLEMDRRMREGETDRSGHEPELGGGRSAGGAEVIPAPADVAAPPADATVTESGLASGY